MRILKRVLIGIPTVMLVLWTVAPFVVSFAVLALRRAGRCSPTPACSRATRRSRRTSTCWHGPGSAALFNRGAHRLRLDGPDARPRRARGVRVRALPVPRASPAAAVRAAPASGARRGDHGPALPAGRDVRGLDSRYTLIVVYTGMLLPLAVWLLTGFSRASRATSRRPPGRRRCDPLAAAALRRPAADPARDHHDCGPGVRRGLERVPARAGAHHLGEPAHAALRSSTRCSGAGALGPAGWRPRSRC